jgi:hypothetical protein
MTTRRASKFKATRKKARSEAEIAIEKATLEELKNMRAELGREIAMRSKATQELQRRLNIVGSEIDKRKHLSTDGLFISDHAVLRYLERIKGIDMQAMRNEISEIAKRADKSGLRNESNSTIMDEETNLTFGMSDTDGRTITTIYNEKDSVVLNTPTVSG